MIIVITGSRSIVDYELVSAAIEASLIELKLKARDISELVSGHAKGVDRLAERWAREHNIPVTPFEVTGEDWDKYGKGAGHRRNRLMAHYALDAVANAVVVAIWNGQKEHSGTWGMMQYSEALGLPVIDALKDSRPLNY